MAATKYASIEDYLAAQGPVKARTIGTVIGYILGEFPELAAKMAWNVPQIHRDGKYVVGLAAYKNHLTFSPWSVRVMDNFRDSLAGYVVFKNCFQVPVDWQIDRVLLSDLVRARLAELEER